MKLNKVFLFLLMLPLIFTGCFQVETNLRVNKDGSGSISEKVLMSRALVDMIKEFAQSFQDTTSEEEFSLFSENEIRTDAEDYGENVEYVSHEFISNEEWEGYTAVYSFSDITKIKLTPDSHTNVDVEMEEESPEEKEHYFFKFIKGNTPELIIDRPDIEIASDIDDEIEDQDSEPGSEENSEEVMKMMEGMSINISIEVDGSIVSTNAKYVEDSKITLVQMDFSEMMKNKDDFEEFKNNEPESIEELKMFLEKFPGMKLETQKPVTIKFQ